MRYVATLIVFALASIAVSSSQADELPMKPERPFRLYSVEEGLNQKTVHAVVQDQDGFLWIATFGGINRFDGQTFESLTASDGLRQNLVQSLAVDEENRLWVGDAAGGLTLVEDGRVTRTYEPDETTRGVARAIVFVNGKLYVGTQPGGLRSLDMSNLESKLQRIEGAPFDVFWMVAAGDYLYTLGTEGVHRYNTVTDAGFELIGADLSAVAAGDNGRVAVGDISGRIGWLNGNEIEWLDVRYEQRITTLSIIDNVIEWVFLDEKGMVPFGAPVSESIPAVNGAVPPLVDQEGVFWVPTRAGLARHLGSRFAHYPLTMDDQQPEVFSIEPGINGDYWFGTSRGLLHVDANGELENFSDTLGIDQREVRDIEISSDKKTLWIAHVQAPTYGINLDTMQIETTIGNEDSIAVSAVLDNTDRLWIGSFLGTLTAYNPTTQTTQEYSLGNGASIYTQDVADDGYLWFGVNFQGLFRLDTNDPSSEPELMVPESELRQEYYTQVVVDGGGADTVVWFSGIKGSVFRWQDGKSERVIAESLLADTTVYAIQPLPDESIVLATSRGVFRYAINTETLEQYGSLDGFVAIEAKVHATYFNGRDSLLIGTTSGVTRMDITLPMNAVTVPKPLITRRRVDGELVDNATNLLDNTADEVVLDFTAVSTRKPTGIEYSYRLTGHSDDWSGASDTTSISYTNLAPGEYSFDVRARLPGGNWSAPATWAFTVPTPYWATWWFIALAVLSALTLTWSVVQWRLRSIAIANLRLREEVAERTRSIETGRRELEEINSQLSSEIEERKRSDALRADVEARFQQAYHNSPIGMALVDKNGLVYDSNPSMKALFWPDSKPDNKEPLLDIVCGEDRESVDTFLSDYAADKATESSMEAECISHDRGMRSIDFHPSAVRNQQGELEYILLLAQDVTDTRAMTDQLEYQANFDELTGLVNRRAFEDRLHAIGEDDDHKGQSYLMFLDLDQFKVVNDTCGHAAGDELLCMVADALRSCVRDNDTVARLGGDEFALIIVGCDESVARSRAEGVRQRIQDLEFVWENEIFRVGASIGVVPIDAEIRDLNELQQLADAACYAAKDAGRNRVHMVSGDEDAAHERRGEMRWVQRLNYAIDNDDFELYGQRILPLGDYSHRTERIEILLRMRNRATNRLIPPGAFLPAAERYGLQGRLDQWVVSRVIDAMDEQVASEMENRQFWVNLSGASIGDPKISRELIRMVKDANLPRGVLNFEITETAVIRKISEAKRLIAALQEMGCRFALDDFGSGLSSFGYLKELNVDCLKIDGQFVRDIATDPTDRIFVKSIIDIAHTLDMQVIAEFIEDDDILQIIRSLGSDFGQGFGIHRPEPLDAMVSMTTAMRIAGLSKKA
ncbi:MAG: EAL domain-containing protein [Pseudomonadota bacterium]